MTLFSNNNSRTVDYRKWWNYNLVFKIIVRYNNYLFFIKFKEQDLVEYRLTFLISIEFFIFLGIRFSFLPYTCQRLIIPTNLQPIKVWLIALFINFKQNVRFSRPLLVPLIFFPLAIHWGIFHYIFLYFLHFFTFPFFLLHVHFTFVTSLLI